MMQAECRGLEKMREHDPLGQTRMESRSSRFGVRRAALLKVRFEPNLPISASQQMTDLNDFQQTFNNHLD
ncbi:hypothetical protein [Salipiger bermudensis]|uniref:hypothetical protein n=1 Tax=Salipiger bermudensis TaxID=344736 RepID=UPI001CD2F213|nr:hypothetical protein [Salipiger bermudensis]MCA0963654.1 hypothetical protein [Salipiger bermudensis]